MADDSGTTIIEGTGVGAILGAGIAIVGAVVAPELVGPILISDILAWSAVGAGTGALISGADAAATSVGDTIGVDTSTVVIFVILAVLAFSGYVAYKL